MKEKKSICFIAQFPPPINGLTKAVETLYNSNLNKEFEFNKIDIKDNRRILITLIRLIVNNSDLYYFTISQTCGGNIRDLIIMNILKLKRKKLIIHLHGGYYRRLIDNEISSIQKALNYKIIKKLDGAIVLGDSLRYIFNGLMEEEKIFVIPNCVDNEFVMDENELNLKLSTLNKEDIGILYLSNFIESKGYKKVLQIAKQIKELKIENIKFKFAGKFSNKNDEDEFNKYIMENELSNIVNYLGVITGEEKSRVLKESNLFILLTNYPKEGQPISILEAMANGMCIFTTNHAGIPDIITNDINGYVFDSNNINIDKVIEKLIYINKNRDEMIEIARTNYSSIKNFYAEKMYLDNINRLFEKI